MQWIKDLKLKPKLMIAFGLVLALMLVQGVASYFGMRSINSVAGELSDMTVPSVRAAGEMRSLIGEYRNVSYQALIRSSETVKQEAKARKLVIEATLDKLLKAYPKNIANDHERAMYNKIVADWKKTRASYASVSEMVELDLLDDAIDSFIGDNQKAHAELVSDIDTLIAENDRQASEARDQAQSSYHTASALVFVLLGASVLGGLTLAWLIARSLANSMGGAVKIANQVASGDLDSRIVTDRRDEIGELLNALQRMQKDLRERIERDQAIAGENLRIRTALDSSSNPTFITDDQRAIIYANAAFLKNVSEHQDNLRQAAPEFDAKAVIGKQLSYFGLSQRTVEQTVAELERSGVAQTEERLGDGVFNLVVTAIRNEQGQWTGDVCEWRDRTIEAQVEDEVARIVRAAAAGDLSGRVDANGKHGFFLQLAQQLNGLLDANAASIDQISTLLSALSSGDLTVRMEGDFQGVFARMRDDANATADQLADIVGRIKHSSTAINTAAGEIAAGNSDLSVRTEQQAANLEETAASMEELTSTVRQNAESARQANQLAVGAADVASKGGAVVGQVVTTMSDIETSSKKIAEIISVIDGIAFQTNILALNAAVEAARAGEQGRGFAVVASEVRTLAQRSANAAKEIKGLIDDSVSKVANGSALVDQAGKTMGEIVNSVQRVTDIMAEIAAASQEQSSGIEQVNLTITQMDETTQQNAALVEEATAAARSMEEQAGHLAEAVSVFRLDAADTQPEPAPTNVVPHTAVRKPKAAAPKGKQAATKARTREVTSQPALAEGNWEEF
ncbi:methyl-accepting chemotaxis protein [Pseudoxanthomonas sp. JBR18]|uniref:methyl-accepting chemotaxis protein n=1 Tax=Pseudoxanthomonas sp. JBR18 TaxID=2969308 RepID=UPI0023050B2E|nr:methyl-accepting chemotaxis protein [Pseudoxanthomonas sp. JBR18]WCE03694.1 methyl-accepting chemotaxis protein [Pseudoxanthomonas sp. JBR18]